MQGENVAWELITTVERNHQAKREFILRWNSFLLCKLHTQIKLKTMQVNWLMPMRSSLILTDHKLLLCEGNCKVKTSTLLIITTVKCSCQATREFLLHWNSLHVCKLRIKSQKLLKLIGLMQNLDNQRSFLCGEICCL